MGPLSELSLSFALFLVSMHMETAPVLDSRALSFQVLCSTEKREPLSSISHIIKVVDSTLNHS